MLDFMRSQAQGWIVKVLFAIIVLSFALWGVGDYFSGESAVTVAEVGDETIHQRPFQRRVQQQRNRLQEQLGAEMGGRISEQPQFRQRILRQMIQSRLLAQEVARLGLTASDEAVARQVHQQAAFQRGGEFDAETYRNALSRAGQTPAKFEERIRQDLAASHLRRLLQEGSVVAEPELARAYRVRNERRAVHYAALAPEDFRDGIAADEDALRTYYDSHQDRYKRSARARVRWVELSPRTYRAATPDEEELRAFYQENKDRFSGSEERRARHILLQLPGDASQDQVAEARERARELAEEARGGADFAELARQNSEGPSASEGGDLGWFARGDMVEAFDEEVFAMEPDSVSDPVRSRFGFHVIRLEDVRGDDAPAFAEVREKVAEEWRAEQGADRLFERLPTFKDLLYTRDSLETVAEEFDLEIHGPVWVPAKGSLPDALPGDESVRETALKTQPGRNSDAVELDSTRFVGLHVLDQQPAQTRPFEAVRDRVAEDYRRDQARKRAREAASELAGAVDGGSLAAAAREQGVTVQEVGPLDREGARRELPGELPEAAFSAPTGEARTASLPDGGQAVLVVDEVLRPDPSEMSDGERRRLVDELRRSRGQARLEGYLEHLRERFPVRIRREVGEGAGSG